jgi:hypothetical protein
MLYEILNEVRKNNFVSNLTKFNKGYIARNFNY